MIAEVYPRLWKGLFPVPGLTADQADAYSVAAWMRREDQASHLDGHFAAALSDDDRALAEVEGWILGLGGEDPKRDQRQERRSKEKRGRSRSEEARSTDVADIVHLWMSVGQNVTAVHSLLRHLSLSQIYSALAHYHHHQRQVDEEIAKARL